MSAILDYGDLLVASGDYSGRNDLAHVFSRFVSMFETKVNRMLRVSQMLTTANVTMTNGTGALPADFLEMREARIGPTYSALRAWPYASIGNRYTFPGVPQGYAISGTSSILLGPSWTGTLPITYYAKIPALTMLAPSNWLLALAPNAYLYGVVEQIDIYSGDVEKASVVSNMLASEINSIQNDDNARRFSNSRVIFGGVTP